MKKNVLLITGFMLLIGIIVSISPSFSVNEEEVDNTNIKLEIENVSKGLEIENAKIVKDLIMNDNKIVDGSIEVFNPGDFVSYTFDIVNNSNNNIIIKNINSNFICNSNILNEDELDSICKNITIDLLYTDDSLKEVKENDILFANSRLNITLNIIYNNSLDAKDDIDIIIDGINIEFNI